MNWRHISDRLTPALALLGAVILLNGCSKDAPQAPHTGRTNNTAALSEAAKEPALDGGPPQTWEFLPFDRRLFEHAGTLDRANRYVSTVMVIPQGPTMDNGCSGVLVHSRLVLTAAHCVCRRRQTGSPEGEQGTLIDGTTCAKRASVTTIAYEASENPERPTLRIRTYEGQVRPHPDFQIRLDALGEEQTNHADLSVILLDQPVELPILGVHLADSEVQLHESLIMAGYGHDRVVGSRHGARYFRKSQVLRAPTSEEERALYAQQGSSLYEGFDGGPCFREQGQEQSLVGITGLKMREGLSFTSIFTYRDWLRAELQRARTAGTTGSPGTK